MVPVAFNEAVRCDVILLSWAEHELLMLLLSTADHPASLRALHRHAYAAIAVAGDKYHALLMLICCC